MRISSNYLQLINRILTEEPGKSPSSAKKGAAKSEDRKELSKLVTVLQQEMERLEGKSSPERAAKLQSLAEQIENGTYYVDSQKLAEAMLKYFGNL